MQYFQVAVRGAYGVALAKLGQANPCVVAMDGDTKNSTYAQKLKVRYNASLMRVDAYCFLHCHRLGVYSHIRRCRILLTFGNTFFQGEDMG